ncbi:hypothetical protein [Variovorax sp. EBFNA2]|uniref:hypothetical protein n=1 Tax=Variovorax sp. EBFNA2 TaxID=3342097 RepID=UPI0029C06CB0|nr:hypothetical protein [Variovorax boronicumulans]WPG41058.1 hypothetical protein RZE79_33765 [Variovorax boronicumulans]
MLVNEIDATIAVINTTWTVAVVKRFVEPTVLYLHPLPTWGDQASRLEAFGAAPPVLLCNDFRDMLDAVERWPHTYLQQELGERRLDPGQRVLRRHQPDEPALLDRCAPLQRRGLL